MIFMIDFLSAEAGPQKGRPFCIGGILFDRQAMARLSGGYRGNKATYQVRQEAGQTVLELVNKKGLTAM